MTNGTDYSSGQHDTHECLLALFDLMDEECKARDIEDVSACDRNFELRTENTVTCLACGTVGKKNIP